MLTFDLFNQANMERLPLFRNKHGQLAHSKRDGSDWSPAQWFQAFMGEVGELAQARVLYETGRLFDVDFYTEAGKEAADVQTYLSIMARRFLDRLKLYESIDRDTVTFSQGDPNSLSCAQLLMHLVAHLGCYANLRKKLERGDLTADEYTKPANESLRHAQAVLGMLITEAMVPSVPLQHPGDVVVKPNPSGITLDRECIKKFNEVSKRVGVQMAIMPDGNTYLNLTKNKEADRA